MSDVYQPGDAESLAYLSAEVDRRIGYPIEARHIGTGGRHCAPEVCRTVRHADIVQRQDGALGYFIDTTSKVHVDAVKSSCVAKVSKTPTETKVAALGSPTDAKTWLATADNVGSPKPSK